MNKEEQTYFKSFQGRAGFIIVFYGAVTRVSVTVFHRNYLQSDSTD